MAARDFEPEDRYSSLWWGQQSEPPESSEPAPESSDPAPASSDPAPESFSRPAAKWFSRPAAKWFSRPAAKWVSRPAPESLLKLAPESFSKPVLELPFKLVSSEPPEPPEPVRESSSKLEPAPEPSLEPAPEPEPETAPESSSKPVPELPFKLVSPEPPEPVRESSSESEPEPSSETAPEPSSTVPESFSRLASRDIWRMPSKQQQGEPPEPTGRWLKPALDSPWKISISEKLEQGQHYEVESNQWSSQSIYRVPKPIRDVDETSYTPQIVAIGPYHRGQSHLSDMERHKCRALHRALHREGHNWSHYIEAFSHIKIHARARYESYLSISANELMELLIVDAIFVLELFRGVYFRGGFPNLGYHRNDPVFTIPGIMPLLQRDMLKLENQLPFFILDNILTLQRGYNQDLLACLALAFFGDLMPAYMRRPLGEAYYYIDRIYGSKAEHCLDFFRCNLLLDGPENPTTVPENELRHLNHSVTELRAASFTFKPIKLSDRFWLIKFKNGILEIPSLPVIHSTKCLFLNLIAFEQCHLKRDKHITTYIMFMDKLINSEEDVKYLHQKGIIENFLGSDGEVADLFNLLCKNVHFNNEDCYLSDLFKEVNIYYNYKWHAWRAILMHKYFSNPWTWISLLAAIFLLLLTLAQTFYAIYGYHKPN